MSPSELPSGIVTFLFTDIEGSTRLLQSIGSRYGNVLEDHHRLLRGAVTKHNGIEISTEGDSFFVAFPNPAEAVLAAVDAQRALTGYAEEVGLDLAVRMGLHTGEGRIVGDNYGGIDVHRAARIASVAHGGQVIVSESTRVLAEAMLRDGIRLEDLGDHHLKDLDQPEHLYQVCIEGLRSKFPPLQSLGARPNNLPVTATTFVARDRQAADIRGLLETNRLVTLTGPGGTGKTRLALQIASEALEDFDDGVFVVWLAEVTDPELVPSTIAASLGLKEQGLRPIAETIRSYLSGKRILLLLDNFEQVVSAGPFVAEMLLASPELKVMATSRAALRISGEQEYPVPPMSLPDPDRLQPVEALTEYEAVTLFVQRARGVKPDFEVTDRNAGAVTEICRRLDGLPLAIELAAARVRLLSPEQIAERLRGGLALLSGGARDLPARQQTLRNAIAWSYELLEEPVRDFFLRLSVFAGGWTVHSADAICNPGAELRIDTLDGLEILTDVNLTRLVDGDDVEARFRMLQTIREFALELFEPADDFEAIRRRHALYFVQLAEENEPKLTESFDPVRRGELEHDNMRAALRWALDRSDAELGLRLGAALWRFWMLRSHLAEGRKWLTELLALPNRDTEVSVRARAVMALGSVTYWQNDFDSTRVHYLEALRLYRETADVRGLAEAIYNAGFISLIESDPTDARRYFQESRSLALEHRDEQGLANAAWGLAICAIQERKLDEAKSWGEEALEKFTSVGNAFGASMAKFVFFQVARFSGDRPSAYRYLLGFQDDAEILGDVGSTQGTLLLLSALEYEAGRYDEATKLMGAAQMLTEKYGGGSPRRLIEVEDPRPAARRVHGDEQTAQLWEEGRAMSPQEAIAFLRKIVENLGE